MTKYILSRIAQAIGVIFLAYTTIFIVIQAMPSDAVTIFMYRDATPDPAEVEAMKAQYGYDQPVIVQYFTQLLGLFQGDFGYSLTTGQTVTTRIGDALPFTIELAGFGFLTALIVAFGLVTLAALTPIRWVRGVLAALPPLFSATPVFWLGLVALQVLSIQLGLMSVFPDGSVLSVLVPVTILGVYVSAPIAQVLFTAVEANYAQPYVEVLRAKGASEARIFFVHVLKNAIPPALTVIALAIGTLVAGSVITETVFARTGIGSIVLHAVTNQDLPVVQGVVLLTATAFAIFNLIVDILYPLLDPRVVKERTGNLAGSVAGSPAAEIENSHNSGQQPLDSTAAADSAAVEAAVAGSQR